MLGPAHVVCVRAQVGLRLEWGCIRTCRAYVSLAFCAGPLDSGPFCERVATLRRASPPTFSSHSFLVAEQATEPVYVDRQY